MVWIAGSMREQQIPCGNARKKSKSNSKCNSRFPAGMEDKKSKCKSKGKYNSGFPSFGCAQDEWKTRKAKAKAKTKPLQHR